MLKKSLDYLRGLQKDCVEVPWDWATANRKKIITHKDDKHEKRITGRCNFCTMSLLLNTTELIQCGKCVGKQKCCYRKN